MIAVIFKVKKAEEIKALSETQFIWSFSECVKVSQLTDKDMTVKYIIGAIKH
jgi:hypothetical protein